METIPITEAKARIAELADRVAREHDHFAITRNGRADVMWAILGEPVRAGPQQHPRAPSAGGGCCRDGDNRGSIAVNPYRAGKPLDEPFDGFYSARRGTYRIVYRIDEAKHLVEIYSIRHRRDAYRT